MPLDPEDIGQLHDAVVAGDLDKLRSLLRPLDGFPDAVPHPGVGRPLVYAIHHGPVGLVRRLLEADADADLDDGDGFPPLIAALTDGRPEMAELVELLLAHRADPDRRGVNDETPLHHAARSGNLVVVELLLAAGADPNATTRIDDVETPLEAAERAGNDAVADRLRPLTTRLDWEAASRDGDLRTIRRMAAAGHDLDAIDGFGQTALMRAAHAGHTETVRWLAEQRAELDHTAKFGLSALMLAVIAGHPRTARALVAAGADIGLRGTGAPGFAGKTAADLAEDRGDAALARRLR